VIIWKKNSSSELKKTLAMENNIITVVQQNRLNQHSMF